MKKKRKNTIAVRPTVKWKQASEFLKLLDPSTNRFSFRTYTDDKDSLVDRNKDPLARKLDGTFEEHRNELIELNRKGAGVFTVVNGGGQSDAEITAVRAVFADQDFCGPMVDLSQWPKPHMVVESSRSRFHVYWLVRNGDVKEFGNVQKQIAATLGTDATIFNASRVMRLPGFVHQKQRSLFRSRLKSANSTLPRYSLQAIEGAIPIANKPVVANAGEARVGINPANGVHDDVLKTAFEFAKLVFKGACSRDAAFEVLVEQCVGKYAKRDVAKGELRRAFDNALTKLGNGSLVSPQKDDDNRTGIAYRKSFSHKVAEAAERALLQEKCQIYQRGDQLVRVVAAHANGSVARVEGPTLLKVTPAWLSNALTEVTRCEIPKTVNNETLLQAEEWPPAVINAILARYGSWQFLPLRGITEVPLLRMSGRVIVRPGYDRKTSLFVAIKKDWPEIPKLLTKDDARSALERLIGLIGTFPYETNADRSVVLAALLTGIVRPLLDYAPMLAVSAPLPGSGKSKLSEIVSLLACGRLPTMFTWGKNPIEAEKRLGAALMRGDPFVCFDNVQSTMDGDLLCSLLTSESVATRVLGLSKMVTLPMSTMLMANGNNLVLAGDTTRRVLVAKLDAKVEHPGDRYFKVNPVKVAKRGRESYVNAALTILSAFLQSKEQPKMKPFGSFERWSKLIRGALIWMGCDDPHDVLQGIRDDDPKKQTLREFVVTWRNVFGSQLKTSAEVIVAAEDPNRKDLYTVLTAVAIGKAGKLDATALGTYLRNNKNGLVGSLRIVRAKENRSGSAVWKVEKFTPNAKRKGAPKVTSTTKLNQKKKVESLSKLKVNPKVR
jgi:putative DNA primase/helicase